MTTAEFVKMFKKSHAGCRVQSIVTRIAFEYLEVPQTCCTAINGSHVGRCPEMTDIKNAGRPLTCWCCGGTFGGSIVCAWSDRGTQCFGCYDHSHNVPCRAHVGEALAPYRVNMLGEAI